VQQAAEENCELLHEEIDALTARETKLQGDAALLQSLLKDRQQALLASQLRESDAVAACQSLAENLARQVRMPALQATL
jgi:hypothetical protein